MQEALPDSCREEQELVPGGDLRLLGNAWLRQAWEASKIERVPREAEVRKVVHQLINLVDVCPLLEMTIIDETTLIIWHR